MALFTSQLFNSKLFHMKDKKNPQLISELPVEDSPAFSFSCEGLSQRAVAIPSVSYPKKKMASDKSRIRLLVLLIKATSKTQVQIFSFIVW